MTRELTEQQAALILLALSESSTILYNLAYNPKEVDAIWPGASASMGVAREHCEAAIALLETMAGVKGG